MRERHHDDHCKNAIENNNKNAQFHWGEGNKFALEFCKTLFLFNSTLAASLIAFIASVSKEPIMQANWHLKAAIFAILVAATLAVFSFALGYFINLKHGNSYKMNNPEAENELWNSGNRTQNDLYALILIILIVMVFGLYQIYQAFL